MTDEQINAAIAEACGWKGNLICRDFNGNLWPSVPPNYCTDLNAMHEAERTLHPTDLGVMGIWIARLLKQDGEWFHAAARQRAEAFLRTLGKWEKAK